MDSHTFPSTFFVSVDFLGSATKQNKPPVNYKEATLLMLEASQRIVQDLCNSNEFQTERLQVSHLGRGLADAESNAQEMNFFRKNGGSGEDGSNAASAFPQQRWAFFSIRPSRRSANAFVSKEQVKHVCEKVVECLHGYVKNLSFVRRITFGVSTNVSLAKLCCMYQKMENDENIKFACTMEEIENLIHLFHPCDGIIPELSNNDDLRMKIGANNIANVLDLKEQKNIGFFTGKLGLSKIFAKKVMSRLEAFSSFASSHDDSSLKNNTVRGKVKMNVSAKKKTHVSELSVYARLNSGDCYGSIDSIGRDLSSVTLFYGIFFNRWPEDLVCEMHLFPTNSGDVKNKGVFEEKVNFPSFITTLGWNNGPNRMKMRESLMREARSILNSQRRCSPSWTTIVDTVGKKLSDLIREVVRDDALPNVRSLRVQASSFVPEQGGDWKILHSNNHQGKGEQNDEENEDERDDDDDDDDDEEEEENDGSEDYQSNRAFEEIYYNALDEEYEGTKHYGGRFEHKLRRKGPNAVASDRAKLTTTRLQTEQKKRTCSEINRDVDRNKRSIQPLVNEIYTSGRTVTRKSRRNTFEPDADATKRLSSKDGEGANVYAVLDFISYGDSNPKVVREVMSAAEVSQRVEEDDERRDTFVVGQEERKDVKSKSIWRDAV